MRRISVLILVLILLLTMTACGNGEDTSIEEQEITIAAAASLTDVFTEMKTSFESENRNTSLQFSFASSGQLQTQIEQGAPVDVYASAGQAQMDALQEKELILSESRRDFARNSIVMVTGASQENSIEGFEEIGQLKNSKIAIGDPAHVPAGQYTQEILDSLGIGTLLEGQLVLCNDARQVVAYVETGEVEIGFVFSSDALASDGIRVIAEAPAHHYDTPLYPMAITKSSENKEVAQTWMDFVASQEGQRILEKWGFSSID